jgi:hypothetical protein
MLRCSSRERACPPAVEMGGIWDVTRRRRALRGALTRISCA